MDHSTDHEIIIMDDRRAFVAAASAISRADEALLNRDPARASMRKTIREEASAIAGLEGHAIRAEAVCRLIGNRDTSHLDRGTRLATDIYDAMLIAEKWTDEPPSSEAVMQVFSKSDESYGRLMRPDVVWTMEDDAAWLSRECEVVFETPEPWVAVDAIRRIWNSGRFQGTSRRMAMLCAPWIVARGFSCASPVHGLAQQIRRDLDGFRTASKTSDEWALLTANSLARAAAGNHRRIGDMAAERATLLALCPPERSSSSISKTIDFMIVQPIFTVKGLCDAVGLTPKGASVVLAKLEDAGVLEVEGGSRNRNYVCRRTI
ncbi:hypothetical protein G6L37_03430 [Agrobacterium rubi]|nr:hypothetical protein [Agrobacterium rubi]NTF24423.1 hypothetical protein [Agrobacterium rubi]